MIDNIYNLTEPQKAIMTMDKMNPDTSVTRLSGTITFDGLLYDLDKLRDTLNYLYYSFDALRLELVEVDNEICQKIGEYKEKVFKEYDFSNYTKEEVLRQYNLWAEENFVDSLTTLRIIKHSSDSFAVYVSGSHILFDAYTYGLTGSEIRNNYEKLLRGEELNYDLDPSRSYTHFIKRNNEYLESKKYLDNKEYFTSLFSHGDEVYKFSNNTTECIAAKRYFTGFDKDETLKIKEFCKENGIFESIFFESIVMSYIKILSGNDSVAIGSPSLNRKGKAERKIFGMFVNPQVLKVDISSDDSYMDLVNNIGAQKSKLMRSPSYPLDHLQHELKEKYNLSGDLFDIVVSYQNASIFKDKDDVEPDYEVNTLEYFNNTLNNSLVLSIDDRDNDGYFTLTLDYKTELFSEMEIENLFNRFKVMANCIVDNKDVKISDIDIFTEVDKRIMSNFNSAPVRDIKLSTIEIFERNVLIYPDNVALQFKDKEYTYKELNDYANSISKVLLNEDLSNTEIIPIIGDRNFYTIVSLIAVAKIGKGYFIIDDSQYPVDRINYLVDEVCSDIILSYGSEYTYSRVRKLDIRNDIKLDFINPLVEIHRENIFCAIHTSGSSGMPKVAIIPDEGVVNMAYNNSYLIENSNSMLSVIYMGFDAFLEDTWLPLLNNKKMILTSNEEIVNVNSICDLLRNDENVCINLTPTRLKQIMDNADDNSISNISTIIIGGEKLSMELVNDVNLRCGNPVIHYLYGPTETTVFNCGTVIEDSSKSVGVPVSNFEIYIKNKDKVNLPFNAIGEIVVIGTGVSLGYYKQEELNKLKFDLQSKKRSYFTGDYAYITENSEMVFCGRKDNQIKINGLRIEIDEIENAMNAFEGINLSSVSIQENNNGDSILVGYFEGNESIDTDKLRNVLARSLPNYMIPNMFMHLDKIPLTDSGKINRNELPSVDYTSHLESIYEAPTCDVQETIIKLWEELLNLSPIGISSTFESLGGTSKMKIDMITKLEKILDTRINVMYLPNSVSVLNISDYLQAKGNRDKDIDIDEYDLEINEVTQDKDVVRDGILLTGSGGFLGSHILNEIRNSNDKIYCLIRNEDKFVNALKFYFDDYEDILKRVVIVDGDLSKDKFGLTDFQYAFLTQKIKTIYHSAANVSHFSSIMDAKKDNVDGTYNCAKLAMEAGASLNHVSTITIAGIGVSKQQNDDFVFTEEHLDIGQDVSHDAYMLSKFKAEELLKKCEKHGLNYRVYRLGYVDARSYDSKFQINDDTSVFKMIVDIISAIKYYPEAALDAKIQVMPVDITAQDIISLSNTDGLNETYHVFDSKTEYLTDYLKFKNVEFEVMNNEDFFVLAERAIKESNDPNYSIVYTYLKSYIENSNNNSISHEFTTNKLKKSKQRILNNRKI